MADIGRQQGSFVLQTESGFLYFFYYKGLLIQVESFLDSNKNWVIGRKCAFVDQLTSFTWASLTVSKRVTQCHSFLEAEIIILYDTQ